MKLNPYSKIQGVLVHYDNDLYRFLPAELASNSNGRLFSNENNKGLYIDNGFSTPDSIKKIFKR